ncbi:MAG: STAS domain-containing protein [Clostridia bacterium]|nr:STAS domain-containing protein [Clostridia bacterium]
MHTQLQDDAMRTPNVQSEYASGVLTLTVSGDIDHHCAASLRTSVDREIYYYRPKLVLLHLGDVTFMDSAGLGFFMGRYQLCKTLGCAFRLVDPPERVMRILSLSGMDRKLTVEKVYRGEKRSTGPSAAEGIKTEEERI